MRTPSPRPGTAGQGKSTPTTLLSALLRNRSDHPLEIVPSENPLDVPLQQELANQNTRFVLSSILHGEQGALSLSASLTQILRDPGATEYAANQTREEARHVLEDHGRRVLAEVRSEDR